MLETDNQKEAQRSRIALFSGRSAALTIGGVAISGRVRAVREDKSSAAARWIITVIPDARSNAAAAVAR